MIRPLSALNAHCSIVNLDYVLSGTSLEASQIGHVFPNDVIPPPPPVLYVSCMKCLKYNLNKNKASVYLPCSTSEYFLSYRLVRKFKIKHLKSLLCTDLPSDFVKCFCWLLSCFSYGDISSPFDITMCLVYVTLIYEYFHFVIFTKCFDSTVSSSGEISFILFQIVIDAMHSSYGTQLW